MNATLTNRHSRGMILMEILIAIAIFGTAAMALMGALTSAAKIAIISQLDMRMTSRLQSDLTWFSKVPQIQELNGEKSDPDEMGVYTVTDIVLEKEMKNSEGQELADMYRITVTAYYDNFGQQGRAVAETLRYARLYSQTGAAGSAGPPAAPVAR